MTKVANADITTFPFYVDPKIGAFDPSIGKWTFPRDGGPGGNGHMGSVFGLDADGMLVLAPPKIALGQLGMTMGAPGNKVLNVWNPNTALGRVYTPLVTGIPNNPNIPLDDRGMRGGMAAYPWSGGWEIEGFLGAVGPANATIYVRIMQGIGLGGATQPGIWTGTFPYQFATDTNTQPPDLTVPDTRVQVGEGFGIVGNGSTLWPIPFQGQFQFDGDSNAANEIIVEAIASVPGCQILATSGPLIAASRGVVRMLAGMGTNYGVVYL